MPRTPKIIREANVSGQDAVNAAMQLIIRGGLQSGLFEDVNEAFASCLSAACISAIEFSEPGEEEIALNHVRTAFENVDSELRLYLRNREAVRR